MATYDQDDVTEIDIGIRSRLQRTHVGLSSSKEDNSTKSRYLESISYNMNHPNRGLALIFDNHSFEYLPYRSGSERDKACLKKTFERIGFKVGIVTNATADEMYRELQRVAKDDHKEADCFLCVFLTHGDDGIIYGYDGHVRDDSSKLNLQGLFDLFRGENCSSLIGKPKIFIVQACRGTQVEDGESMVETDAASVYQLEEGTKPTVPSGADFLISYSSSKGYFSHRDTQFGSSGMQDLVRVLEKYGTSSEFTQLLTLVNNLVAKRSVERCQEPRLDGKKQMPCFLSMLTRELIFTVKQ